ncbi:hypothetical protein KEM60_00767 [Austwickia sp. TVS 96-490-7B]|uniref:glycosyltransferase n=1 Tax=Austwickia sp. TVS 96-490-7B TaxID=2830843 RepID=UPI001C565336|nr:glycosyltransferase [Austwickia sp. TVS 96-490-7B]MBW3084579.1 hypothetical protein [Austwickia sp. TVS 96-490-7B]
MTSTQEYAAAVIIPAHNEAGVIDRCLDAVDRARNGCDVQIVVVANGCSDDTAHRARRHPGVQVVDIETGSKSLALTVGDRTASAFPRIYVDADVVVDEQALTGLITALNVEEPLAGTPRPFFDVAGSSAAVRAYYRVFTRLPYVREGLIGGGVYGMSRAGRARFGDFPDHLGDDLFVQRMFAPQERVVTAGSFRVLVPRTVSSLVKVRTRVARGNAQIAEDPTLASYATNVEGVTFAATTGGTVRALATLLRHEPARCADAVVYVAVTLIARRRARRTTAEATMWERDVSTRVPNGAVDASGAVSTEVR